MAYTTIDDPSEYFQTQLYTGDGNSTQAITNSGNSNLKPDWVWLKQRANDSANRNHMLFDSTRGSTKALSSNTNGAEDTSSGGYIQSFNTDGFTTGSSSVINKNAVTYVAWQWKANGGTTTTNDASSTSIGNTDSVIQANTEAGFSIVTFSGTGSGMTVAHGLGGTPDLIISKARNDTENWAVHTTIIDGSVDFLRLSETDAKGNSSFSAATSTVFGYNGSNNYVVYCFRSIKGYSKIGSYTGNGAQDGTFVYTGFKPAFILAKRTDAAKNWYIADSTRSPSNITKAFLSPNLSNAEDTSGDGTDAYFDILSNGFKMRQDFSHLNASGAAHIYMAFAENPFVSSKGVPTTAR